MGEEARLDNRRIMKNSMMLYLRTFLTMAIGLYSSRVVLQVLGIDDFGIYGVVGSLVLMFGFFTSTMASAMSRFLSFEIGTGDKQKLGDTFAASLMLMIPLALVILLFLETGGLWIFSRINIPEQSRGAAMWVYQFSILTMLLNILQGCYLSAIIAHERMGVFAYLEIINATGKLAIIFLLEFVMVNKLILYGFLVMMVMLGVTITTMIYARRNFEECRRMPKANFGVIRPLLSFCGWSLYRTACDTFKPTGINVLVNLFFGVALNAAVSVAMNVNANLAKFISSVFLSFKPQIIKAYAMQAYANLQSLINNALRFSISLQAMVSIPLILEMPFVLKLWLGIYPPYAVAFCRLLTIALYFEVMITIVEYAVNATGKIRTFSITNGTLLLSTILFSWIVLELGASPEAVYYVQICVSITCLICDLTILKKLIPQIKIRRIVGILILITAIAGTVTAISYLAGQLVAEDGFARFCVVGATDVFVMGACVYAFVLPASGRLKIRRKLHLAK